MIIDATDMILGRFATVAAKNALQGEEVIVVNCQDACITGNKQSIIKDFKDKRTRGVPLRGPYYPKGADRIVRRAIRGMLPYKKPKGRDAFKRVMCYLGVPEDYQNKDYLKIKGANISKLPNLRYVKLGTISKLLGAKTR